MCVDWSDARTVDSHSCQTETYRHPTFHMEWEELIESGIRNLCKYLIACVMLFCTRFSGTRNWYQIEQSSIWCSMNLHARNLYKFLAPDFWAWHVSPLWVSLSMQRNLAENLFWNVSYVHVIRCDCWYAGLLYDHGHLSRAVCCRLAHGEPDIADSLPPGFHINHPLLGRVTTYDPPREIQKTKELSMNWVLGDQQVELTDGTKGICISTYVTFLLFDLMTFR